MGDKRSPTRPKRQPKPSDEGFWDCSVCTYKNTAEAFKCMMCDVRKGTSTSVSALLPNTLLVSHAGKCCGKMATQTAVQAQPQRHLVQIPPAVTAVFLCVTFCGASPTPPASVHPSQLRPVDPRRGNELGSSFRSPRKPRPVSQQQVTQQFVLPSQPKKEKKERAEREKSDREPSLKKNSHKKMRPRLKNIDRSSAQHLEVTVGDLTVIITDFKEKAKPSATSSSATSATDLHSQNGSSSENTEKGLSRSSSPRGEGSSVNGESH
ncbi:unnamed protein product [Tetraodon nigroviridis]|uniref:(spotted green pufferfish) hypothetical protein n=1 Tax=Tetraodon nigroviridis TaxID=99883 RepID=Q4RHM9_TETNG|nr:unnamed protein product [Tetraodon nigroviridis]